MKQDEGYLYIIVCFRIYEVGGPCADTLDALVLRSHMNKRRVSDLLDRLFRAGKLIRTAEGIMNPFASEVLAEMEQFRETRQRAGLRGAQQRWKKDEQKQQSDDGTAMCLPMANDSHLHLHKTLFPLETLTDCESLPSSTVVGASRRRAARATMREDWEPTGTGFQYARDLGFAPEKISTLVRACRDYHLKHGTLIAGDVGLAATWRTWCNNEIKFAKERQQNGPRGSRAFQDHSHSVTAAANRLQERIREGGFVELPPRPNLDSTASENDHRLLPSRRGN
jgi:hypothetical protein